MHMNGYHRKRANHKMHHWNTFRFALSSNLDECFYLNVKENDTVHVIYQVLKGGNNKINFRIYDSNLAVVYTQLDSTFGWYDKETVETAGTCRICLNNDQYFKTKTVYLAVLAIRNDLLPLAVVSPSDEKNDTGIDEFTTKAM
ncbi:unnamed protein product, partial [Didymodactylos carnosus]